MKNVAMFIRESNHAGAEDSAKRQAKQLQDYCEKQGYMVRETKKIIGDRVTAFPQLLDLLNNGKANGIDTVLMPSTNRIIGTVEEIERIQAALQESGLAIETMDGSHNALYSQRLVESFLARVEMENDEQMFGYDDTPSGPVVNAGEAEVVQYAFQKMDEYSKNPPAELVQAVVDDFNTRGVEITQEEAKAKVSMHQVMSLIEQEIRSRWPDQYLSMIQKKAHNEAIRGARFAHGNDVQFSETGAAPIVDQETWNNVQEKLRENSGFTMDEPKF